ncbi:MAG: biopolymer transporter ExbD [Candidatus Omnitrophica bacterium]|nr:biopolymer transporter ExbD [Candidatus Omnitrophota bacterium]
MIFRIKTKPHVALETIAFADIVINLFVFFFISFGLFATFDSAQKGAFPIELPKTTYTTNKKTAGPLIVTIDRRGFLYVGKQAVQASQLKKVLSRELSSRKEKKILVRADRTISLERFVSVLDIIRSTKASAISIETEK